MRLCDICHVKFPDQHVYSFPSIMADLGLEGTQAHVGCILAKRKEFEKRQSRQGIRSSQIGIGNLYCR